MKSGPTLGLIPARSGSLRIRNKNLRMLGGKPLIAHTIEAAKRTKFIDRLIVSTDSEEIARVARKWGAETPFLRPRRISGPHSTEFEFHHHALNWLIENEAFEPSLIVNLYPTGPFRKPETIDKAIERMRRASADSLRSVRICSEHPYKMWVNSGSYLKPFVSTSNSSIHTLSYQSLPKVFIQNASIYITRPITLRRYKNTVGKKVLAFEMTSEESFDINAPLDFEIARFLVSKLRSNLTR